MTKTIKIKPQSNKNTEIFKLFLAFLLIIVLLTFFVSGNSSKSWQFYTKESIGANNKLEIYNNLVFDGDSVIFNSQNKVSYSLNQNSGNINWKFEAQGYSPFPSTIYKDQVFLSSFDGSIYSLNKKTGCKNWQFNIDGQIQPDTPIIGSSKNDFIFFGSRNGVLYALNGNNGKLIWLRQFQKIDTGKAFIPNTIHFGNIYADNEQVYVLNALEKSFYAINQTDGTINWQIKDVSFSFDSPLFYDQTIILKQENYLLSIDKNSGSYKKIERVGKENATWQPFKVENDQNYFLILDKQTLKKITIDFKKIEWQIDGIDEILNSSEKEKPKQIELMDNRIILQKYLRLENLNELLAINYEQGQTLWELPLNSKVLSQIRNNKEIILGSNNGDLNSIDIESGKVNWQIKTDGEIIKLFLIKNNILAISQKPSEKFALSYLDKNGQIIWQYAPDLQNSKNEIYQNNDYIYFLNDEKKIIEKIVISEKNPEKNEIKKTNFYYKEIKNQHDPYLELKEKEQLTWKLKEKILKIKYFAQNFKNIFLFGIDKQISDNVFEISIRNDENLYKNKFTDLEIEATFNLENEKKEKTTINGFYYDNNIWKIRFIAPKKGNYTYQIKIKSPYFSKRITSSVYLEETKAEKIEIKNDHFTLNSKKAFFPIGLQTAFFDQNYDGNFLDEMPSSSTLSPVENQEKYSYIDLNEYLEIYKSEAGLNIFRYGVENWTPQLWQSIDNTNISFSINGGKFGDSLLQELKRKDFKVIMTIFGFYPPYQTTQEINKIENQKALEKYLDYVIARFSTYVDLWELSNEAEASQEWYKIVTNYLKNNDPYQHPISTNWETNSAKDLDFLSVHWYNLDETDPGSLSNHINFINRKYDNLNQAILISEFGFKNYSYFENSSESMRILSWLSIFQKMGVIFWNQGQNGIYANKDNANIYLGPVERDYLLSLSNFLPKDMSLPIKKYSSIINNLEIQVYSLQNEDLILFYLLKINENKQNKGYLEINLEKDATLQWIEPKTNSVIQKQTANSGLQQFLVPNFKTDLALKITYLE